MYRVREDFDALALNVNVFDVSVGVVDKEHKYSSDKKEEGGRGKFPWLAMVSHPMLYDYQSWTGDLLEQLQVRFQFAHCVCF